MPWVHSYLINFTTVKAYLITGDPSATLGMTQGIKSFDPD
jgi:hypothetical protein